MRLLKNLLQLTVCGRGVRRGGSHAVSLEQVPSLFIGQVCQNRPAAGTVVGRIAKTDLFVFMKTIAFLGLGTYHHIQSIQHCNINGLAGLPGQRFDPRLTDGEQIVLFQDAVPQL